LDSRRYRFAPNAERPAFLSLPTSPAVSFANHQLPISNHLVSFGCGYAALCSFAAISSRSKKASALSERKVSKDKRKDTSGDD
jgi:hypothetical protein